MPGQRLAFAPIQGGLVEALYRFIAVAPTTIPLLLIGTGAVAVIYCCRRIADGEEERPSLAIAISTITVGTVWLVIRQIIFWNS